MIVTRSWTGGDRVDGRVDEFAMVNRLARRLAHRLRGGAPHVLVGIGDDAAVLAMPSPGNLLVSTDTLVEGVHFTTATMDYPALGHKAVAVSISDIAAMGGTPQSAVLAIAVPNHVSVADLEAMYDGVDAICSQFDCPLVGGNLTATAGPLVITSTVTGTVPAGQAVLRSGAQLGDVVFVTGQVGASAAGLALLQGADRLAADDALWLQASHQRPLPQVVAGQILREAGATSMNDVSDGLASELNELARASGVRLRIDAGRVPIAAAVRNYARRRGVDALQYAWYGGEDYQLVGTASGFAFARALMQCEAAGIALTRIGRVEAGDGVVADVDGRLEVLPAGGFNHFRTDDADAGQ